MKPSSVSRIAVEFGGELFNLDLAQQSLIENDPEGLNRCLSLLPGEFAQWASLEQKARDLVEKLEAHLEYKDAELYGIVPAALEAAGRKATHEAIRSKIITDPVRKEIVELLAKAKSDLGMLTVGRQMAAMKRDSVLALASNMRAEMSNQLRTAKKNMDDFYSRQQ
jgi:hypothetical protein